MNDGNVSLNYSFEQDYCLKSEYTNIAAITTQNVDTFVDNNRETALPHVTLNQFDFALPPTPETSLHSWSEKDANLYLGDESVESNLPGDISTIAISPASLDLEKYKIFDNDETEDGEENALNGSQIELPSDQIYEKINPVEKEKRETSRCKKSSKLGLGDKFGDSVSKKKENISKTRTNNLLKFPPCVICGGKATGSHYGAITCEACKGFFRRHLQKKTDFKCTKGGNCEIVSIKKGICSGCRLKKCLDLGMSKEKSKLGRYTLSKRTEAIINMNRHEEKQSDDSSQMRKDNASQSTDGNVNELERLNEENSLIVSQLLQGPKSLNFSQGFNDLLVTELVQCFNAFEPYGPSIKTKEEIAQAHKTQSEKYKQKIELFGKMKAISRGEYNEIYTQYGIDLDGRMADMKLDCESMDSDMTFYCNFAKHIPEFHKFSMQDQVSLLNTLIMDFFTVVYLDCYSDEFQTFISKNGHGYHYEEIVGREFSEKLVTLMRNVHYRLQMLNLSIEEKVLTAALTLVSADRCKLQNRDLVEKVQLSLTELLQTYIKKTRKEAGNERFTKIIDSLTYMREMSEQHMIENNELCEDEVLLKEFPFIKEFIIKEND